VRPNVGRTPLQSQLLRLCLFVLLVRWASAAARFLAAQSFL
jgi:hypothetical protein